MAEWFFDPLTPMSYEVIVCDPPWRFRTWGDHNQAKSASKHYSLMQTADINAMPVGKLAQKDCILLLWSTGAMMPQALEGLYLQVADHLAQDDAVRQGSDGDRILGEVDARARAYRIDRKATEILGVPVAVRWRGARTQQKT